MDYYRKGFDKNRSKSNTAIDIERDNTINRNIDRGKLILN